MINPRFFVQRATVSCCALLLLCIASNANAQPRFEFMEATIPQLQAALSSRNHHVAGPRGGVFRPHRGLRPAWTRAERD